MKNEMVFGNFGVTIWDKEPEIEHKTWIGVTWQAEAPDNLEGVSPDIGWASDHHESVEEAAVYILGVVMNDWDNGGKQLAVELLAAFLMLSILPMNVKLSNNSAVIDGRLFYGEGDAISPDRAGVHLWNEWETRPAELWGFSEAGLKLATEIQAFAQEEEEEWERNYEKWEATWIDGPQWD